MVSPGQPKRKTEKIDVWRGLVALAFAACVLVAGAEAAEINDVDVSSATYVGGSGDDVAAGSAVALDGTLLFVGSLPNHDPGGTPVTTVLGGGAGAVVRYSGDGREVLGITRVGSAVRDLEVASDGRVAVAASGVGLVMLRADLSASDWHDPLDDPVRVAIGGMGAQQRVAVLTGDKRVRVFDAAGALVGERSFVDSAVADVAVSAAGDRVIVTGFNNRSTGGTPVQVPFLRGFDPTTTTQQWRAYDWTADQLVSEQNSSLADSRGVRVAIGADGALYFAGRTDGGNNTFRFDPLIVDRQLPSDELISYDAYSNTAGISGAFAITVFGRFDVDTGDVEKIQYLLARLSSGSGNTVVPAAITADANGRVFVGGRAFATVAERDALQLDGQPVGPYQGGEAFVLAVEPDFSGREIWTVFTAPGGSQNSTVVGIGERAGRVVWTADLANSTARMLTVDAVQSSRDGGESAYLGTRLWNLFSDGFETGNAVAWSATVGAP